MSTNKSLSVATEAIDFQGDDFFKQLVANLGTLPQNERSSAKNSEWEKLESLLEKSVEDRTGLQIEFDLAPDGMASIMTPIVDWSHVFHGEMVTHVENPDELIKFITKAKQELNACLDLKKCHVTGTLAKELRATIQVNREMLYRETFGCKFTDEEIAGIILHEIGHFWTMLEFLDRSVATNQVLAELQRDLFIEKEPSKRNTIIKTAGKELNLDRNVVESLQASDDQTVSTVFVAASMKAIRTQSGHSFYDMNTWEMLADQFAARHGAGRHMFTGMQKLMAQCPDLTMMSRASFYYGQIARFVGGILLMVGGVAGVVAAPAVAIIGIIAVLIGYAMVTNDGGSYSEPTYDNDLGRLTRLRNQQVQAIKKALGHNKSKFNAAYVKQLTEDVAFMDNILKQGFNNTAVVNKIITFFSANEANRQANTAFQKHLEGLAHNDLYAKAAALKTI